MVSTGAGVTDESRRAAIMAPSAPFGAYEPWSNFSSAAGCSTDEPSSVAVRRFPVYGTTSEPPSCLQTASIRCQPSSKSVSKSTSTEADSSIGTESVQSRDIVAETAPGSS